ncbi:MAG: hypothetical protein ACYC2R_14745 [Burkholderiales bacterium]
MTATDYIKIFPVNLCYMSNVTEGALDRKGEFDNRVDPSGIGAEADTLLALSRHGHPGAVFSITKLQIGSIMQKAAQVHSSAYINGYVLSGPGKVLAEEVRTTRWDVQCFGTERRYDCAELCEWRRECRGMVAAWLRR